MKITVDTNVLVRSCVCDDPAQADIAAKILTDAALIAIALPCLCEFVWVLLRVYNIESGDVINAVRALMASENVEMNRPAVEAGFGGANQGGEFACGAILLEGKLHVRGTLFFLCQKKRAALISQGKQEECPFLTA